MNELINISEAEKRIPRSIYVTIAKICGCNDSFNDFKTKYDQYREEIKESLPKEENQLSSVEVAENPFRNIKHF